ncbi:MAG TPA: 7TM diverse intracellular signaling domain-containing protein [Mucilaginibacter sp.]|nr:7TM diverse intracellular signaling domain-containing protein [Mucilaginibacter sp.]
MKKILLILCLLIQNTFLFASTPDTLTIHENESILLTHRYFLELEDPKGSYKINEVVAGSGFHTVASTLPTFRYSKSTTWLKFILKNKTTRPFVPISISPAAIDSFDLYYVDPVSKRIINLSSAVPYRDTKLIKQTNSFINAIIFPDSVRTVYLRIHSSASSVIPININSANSFFKSADFENLLLGAFMGISAVMAIYNLMLFIIVKERSYLYYVAFIVFLALSQMLQRGYGTSFFSNDAMIINNYFIPFIRALFGYSVLLFAAEFLQLKTNLGYYGNYYYSLYVIYTVGLVATSVGLVSFAYDIITIAAALTSITLLSLGTLLYFRGFKPAKYFMTGWGLFLVTMLISIARNNGLIIHNDFTANIIIYSSMLQLALFSIALADKINFYRRQTYDSQVLALTIAKENERLTTEQNIELESKVNARTHELIKTNKDLSKIIEDLKSAQSKLIETEKMASLGQLTAGVAHEINNPINFVNSNVKPLRLDFMELFALLQKYKEAGDNPDNKELLELAHEIEVNTDINFLKEEIQSLLDGIEDGANRTAEIVQSLRTFSRTDEQALKLADINKAVLSALVLLRNTIPYNIEIIPVLNKLPMLYCYPGKINQVLVNLINNGIQAIKAKSRQANESLRITTSDHPENITIEIADTGVGMPAEVKQRMFEPFFTTKDVGEGTGLGLAIVFGIIEDHHGTVDVQSEPGKGTTFIITLPKNLGTAG